MVNKEEVNIPILNKDEIARRQRAVYLSLMFAIASGLIAASSFTIRADIHFFDRYYSCPVPVIFNQYSTHPNMEDTLQIAVRELGQAVGAAHTRARLHRLQTTNGNPEA